MTEGSVGPGRTLGRIEGALFRLFTKSVTVGEVETLGERFLLLTLKGDALRQVAWAPGQKVQLQLGGWVLRTFTPLAWDCVAGSMRPALLFGDETSFGLAHALRFTPNGARDVDLVLEVTSKEEALPVLERLGLSHAQVVERSPEDAHLSEVEEITGRLLDAHAIENCVLTGKASSIQRVKKRLRTLGFSGRQVRKRAYWAPGKGGTRLEGHAAHARVSYFATCRVASGVHVNLGSQRSLCLRAWTKSTAEAIVPRSPPGAARWVAIEQGDG